MAVPDFQTLMLPVLKAVGEAEATKPAEVRAYVADLSGLTPEDLEQRLRTMSPTGFEGLIVDLLVAMGYGGGRAELAQQTRATNDGGIDGLIKEDPLGLDLVVMQAKRYAPGNAVGRPDVQSFAGSLDGNKATKGIFVTTSTFTAGAIDFARSIQKRLVLIDGEELTRLMIRHGVGVRVTQTFELKDIDENVFEEG